MDKKNKYGFEENLAKLFIKRVTNDQKMTLRIMFFLYPENPKYKFLRCESGHFHSIHQDICPYCVNKNNSFINKTTQKYKKCDSGHFYNFFEDSCPHCLNQSKKLIPEIHVVDQYKSDKHKEIVDSLNYLKSKPNKTKQDKESIHTLEVILKNFS